MSKEKPPFITEDQFQKLRDELLEETKNQDDLKSEILKSLQVKSRWKEITYNPAFLLVVGFILTSGIGAFLTNLWQEKDKKKQAVQTITQNTLKNKTEILNETSKIILQTYAATSDMILIYENGEIPSIRDKVLLERMDYWQKTSREWREKFPVLEKKLKQQFTDPKVSEYFTEIISLRGTIGGEIPDWRTEIQEKGWNIINHKCIGDKCADPDCANVDDEKFFANKIRCTNIHNEAMKEKTLLIIEAMMAEIKKDETDTSEADKSFLDWLL